MSHGFKRSASVPVAFVHEEKDMIGAVHGDDFLWEGRDKDLDWELKVMKDSKKRKEANRRKHSKPGAMPHVGERDAHIVKEVD